MLTTTRLLLSHQSPGAIYFYAPPPRVPAYQLRNELIQLAGLRLVWYNRLATVREYQSRHWVAQHENSLGFATIGRYKDYLRPLVASAGFGGSVESLHSAATLLLRMLEYRADTADLATVEFIIVRDANLAPSSNA